MNGRTKQTILFSPLGWGLGHASRIIPLIHKELQNENKVMVAGDESSLSLIKSTFPGIEAFSFKSIKIKFRKGKSQLFPLAWFALRLPFVRIWEHRKLQQIIKESHVNMVISDNRYGLYSKHAFCVIITHQLRLIPPKPFGFAQKLTELLLKNWLKKFDEVWIPDYPNEKSIAGKLSGSNGLLNLKYIGILSRFTLILLTAEETNWELIGIVSGPEPQRTIFEKKITQLAQKLKVKSLILEGLPTQGDKIVQVSENVWKSGHLSDANFYNVVKNAKYVISRSGYSTVMDLLAIEKSALLVPTPGQTEQEYLAKHLAEKGLFESVTKEGLLNIEIKKLMSPVALNL